METGDGGNGGDGGDGGDGGNGHDRGDRCWSQPAKVNLALHCDVTPLVGHQRP